MSEPIRFSFAGSVSFAPITQVALLWAQLISERVRLVAGGGWRVLPQDVYWRKRADQHTDLFGSTEQGRDLQTVRVAYDDHGVVTVTISVNRKGEISLEELFVSMHPIDGTELGVAVQSDVLDTHTFTRKDLEELIQKLADDLPKMPN